VLKSIPRKYTIVAIAILLLLVISAISTLLRQADANTFAQRISKPLNLTTNKLLFPPENPRTKPKKHSGNLVSKKTAIIENPLTKTISHTFVIQRGDSLSSLFKKAGLNDSMMLQIIAADKGQRFRSIHPKQTITFNVGGKGHLKSIILNLNRLKSIQIYKTKQGIYLSKLTQRKPEIIPAYISGTITDSLFSDAEKAGLTQRQIMQLTNIFSWEIDFSSDLRKGDHFSVLYEKRFLNGKKISNGRLLVATFTNKGNIHKAVLFTNKEGQSNYFTPSGKSLKTAFLRMPIAFARISSHFSLRRKHPVLHLIRAHKGTDYAAARGTPIHASGNGKIVSVGWKGGYGRTILIRHSHGISTLYAHMSRFKKGIKPGVKVKQGETIGYVGSSGLATGPHLHYEFRVNGIQKNPEKVKLPHAPAIASSQRLAFKQQSAFYLTQLKTFKESAFIALNKTQ